LTYCLESETIAQLKPAIFHTAAREAFRSFPADVRRTLGKAIWELQLGIRLGMPLSRPMPSVAAGVEELRVKNSSGGYRAFYFSRSSRGILVFHAFQKKSAQTPIAEIKLGRKRLKELLNEAA
jgi:phage-related protein